MEFRNSGTASGSNQAYSHTPKLNPIQPNIFGMNPKSAENSEKFENATHRTPNTFSPPYPTEQLIEFSRAIDTPTKSKAPSTSSASPQKQLITSPNYTVKDPLINPSFPLTSTLPEPGKLGSPSQTYSLKQLVEPGRPNDTPMKSKAPSTSSTSPQKQLITSSNYAVKDPFIHPYLFIPSTLLEPGKLELPSQTYPLKQLVEPGRPNDTPRKRKAPSTSSASPQKQLITSPNYTVKDPLINPDLPLTSTLLEPGKLESPSQTYPLKQLVEPGRPNDTPRKRKARSTSSASPQKLLITSPNYTVKDSLINPGLPLTSTLLESGKLGSPSQTYPLKQLVEPGRPNDTHRKSKAPSTSSASPQKQLITSSNNTVNDPLINLGLPLTSTLTESEPQEKTPEICLSYIWKKCKLEDKCTNIHYHLPYRWQVQNGSEWKDLPDMEDIERAYSEPAMNSFETVNFQTMTSNAKPVRRLSTPSSVTQPPMYVLTTEWIWYWSDESNIWIEYGHSNSQKTGSSIVSLDLEKKYVSDPKETFPFTAATNNYVINFQEMKQENTLFTTKREVRRRPKFLDCKNVRILKGCTKSAVGNFRQELLDTPLKTGIFPPEWDMNTMPKSGYQKVLLGESSTEFVKIVQMFQKTVLDYMVKRLWRIENSYLWKAYCLQKEEMKTRNAGKDVNELLLFHGTRSDNIDKICSENFDWRVCGTNGTYFGEGSYFARDASYSHTFSSKTSSDTLMMIVARVLVGDFVTGDCRMKRPPEKPHSTQRYDSCVNNISAPSIFVVFDKPQIYPQYILEYKKM